MKICYLYLSSYSSVKSGVDNKVISKCIELKKLFPESKFIRLSTQKQKDPNDYFDLHSFDCTTKKYFQNINYNKSLFAAISNLLSQQKNEFDFYILRYPFASKPLLQLLKQHPNKIIFEHNTNERKELELVVNANRKKIPFSLSPSVIAYYIESIFFANNTEKKIGPKCLELAAAGIAVTPEIARIEKNLYNNYKTIVITNGTSVLEKTNAKQAKGTEILNGVFLAGTNAEWNGIERMIESYKKSNVEEKIELYFVGRIENELKTKYKSSTIHFLDYLDKNDLKELLQKMHFAIGTCAIHKKGLTEGAVLKVREYLISGLPIVLGHSDPYIESIPELNKYCVNFPANDSHIDFNLIYSGVKEMYLDKEINNTIQNLAQKHLSWEAVLKPLPAFLKTLKQ